MSGLAAFYLELLRNAHMAAVEDGAVLTGGQTLGLGSRIDDNMLFNTQTGFNDIPAAYTIPAESREVNALADAELVNLGLTRVQLVDLLVNQFNVRPSHLAYAWDIPTYAVMRDGRRQSEELPEFYTGNPLDPASITDYMQSSAYRPNNRWTVRQGKDVSGDTRPSFDEATGMQHQVAKHPDAQGPIYEHTNPFIANSATGWAIEAAFGAVFGPTGIRIMRTGGGKAFDLLAANLDLPEPLRNQFANIADWLRPPPKLTVLPGGGEGGPPPPGRTGGAPYDVAGETGPPPGVAGGAEFPIPPDRIPDMEIPDADVIPFPTDRFDSFVETYGEGQWVTADTGYSRWETEHGTYMTQDEFVDLNYTEADLVDEGFVSVLGAQHPAPVTPFTTDAVYGGMTLEDIGELQGVAASEVTPAHIAEAVDAGVLSEADAARLLDPFPRTPEVPGQQSLFEEIEAMRPRTWDDATPQELDEAFGTPEPGGYDIEGRPLWEAEARAESGPPEEVPSWMEGPPGTPERIPTNRVDEDLIERYPQGYMPEDFVFNEPKVFDPDKSPIEQLVRDGEITRDQADALLEGVERIRTFPNAPGREAVLEGLPSGGPFAGDPRMNPTLWDEELGDLKISRNLIMHNSGGELGVGGALRPMVIVDLGDGRLQPFYRRSGTGNRGAEADLIAGGGGGGQGNWVPFDGIGINAAPEWFRKEHYTGHGLDSPLFRYGTEELKAVGETLDRSATIQAMLNDPQRQIPVQAVTENNIFAGTENYMSSEGMNQLLGTHTRADWAKPSAGPMRQASSTDWEFYLPPIGRMTDDELRAGLQWKIDGPPSTSKGVGGKVAAGMVAGPVAGLAAEAAFPTQVKQVMTGLADRADSWWSWIKDYPDHLEWITRSVGSTLDGLEKGSRSTGNQTVDLLSDGFRDQSNALLMSLGGGAVPVMSREDADLIRQTSKDLSQQGHNGQAIFSNDVRKEMEAGDAMVVGYRSEQDYQRALEQAGQYGLEIDRHFWRKPNRKNIRPARGQEWTRDDLKKLATTNHFYPDAGLRRGPR